MKKLLTVLLALMVVSTMVFAQASSESKSEGPSGSLVLYTTIGDAEYHYFVDPFMEKYPNIQIDVVNGGAGELKTRIQSEAGNPQCDVMFGGLVYSDAVNSASLWDGYISPNVELMGLPKKELELNWITTQVVNLLINKEMIAELGIEVKGYEDLLQPELKGKIVMADPTSSSSGWNNLASMMTVMGNGDPSSEAAWDYVTKLIGQLDGKISSSSSKTYKNVLQGEYPVGITYEGPCIQYFEDGVADNIEIVYMEEGTIATTFGSAVVKNAPHMENAKLFADWITSEECQAILASTVQRGANMNVPVTNEFVKDASEIKFVTFDEAYFAANQDAIRQRWTETWAQVNSGK
ncbi:MAG: extracellular solute-binding protein [Sphaerochaetaceae bacterium]|nr:extracellular solute-binding protein [Sphaerochaetaceae bacterium]